MQQECCEIDNIFEKGFLFFVFTFEWVGGMSLCLAKEVQESKSHMEKTINEDKRQKTWGLDLETSSELELDGG